VVKPYPILPFLGHCIVCVWCIYWVSSLSTTFIFLPLISGRALSDQCWAEWCDFCCDSFRNDEDFLVWKLYIFSIFCSRTCVRMPPMTCAVAVHCYVRFLFSFDQSMRVVCVCTRRHRESWVTAWLGWTEVGLARISFVWYRLITVCLNWSLHSHEDGGSRVLP
jgi:hypothetical protein